MSLLLLMQLVDNLIRDTVHNVEGTGVNHNKCSNTVHCALCINNTWAV